MSTKVTLVLGGARSGKSGYAEKLAGQLGRRVLYIATAEGRDEEMVTRIAAHRRSRPAAWPTLEAPRRLGTALATVTEPPEVLLLDCLTLLVSNTMMVMESQPAAAIEAAVFAEIEALLEARAQWGVPLIVVSSEVGLGLVPTYALGRLYRDVLGRANQHVAALADR
ncbi:MAG: bifunctional adenosylcobinamide kinase/adenosylcobinamide-phosphate guanylyltransferase, partial [Chloroflexota bacterium]